MEAGAVSSSSGRPPGPPLHRSLTARLPDRALRWTLGAVAVGVLVLLVYFFYTLYDESRPLLSQVGIFDFVTTNDWNPAKNQYGAWALVVGTLITSALALLMGVPVAVAVAIFSVELAPAAHQAPADRPDRAARGGPVGRLRALGRVRPDPEPEARRAVVLGHVRLPAVRRRAGRGPELLHRRA